MIEQTGAGAAVAEEGPIKNVQTIEFEIGEKTVSFEYGRMARSATGSVVVRCDDAMILVTATGSEKPRDGIDFFPLLCDYEERMYSVGRMPGGFIKREGRPSERAVLTCRLMDRPIRPLWPEGYKNDVQIVSMPLCADQTHPPDVLSILGASMALELSGLPFAGPLGAVRVARIENDFVLNPTFEEIEEGDLDLVVAGTEDSIMMVEAGSDFVTEADMLAAIDFAHEAIRKQVKVIREFAKQCGAPEKKEFVMAYDATPLKTFIEGIVAADVETAYHNFDRDARKEIISGAKEKMNEALAALGEDHELTKLMAQSKSLVADTFKKVEKRIMRTMIVNEGVRADGRKTDQIRPISCEVGVVPRVHGSALFTRGNTQALCITTLGSPGDKQKFDGADPLREKRWIHHYAFPPYSVGEVRPLRGAGRREIGHGALAERAIFSALPDKEDFPYTMRVNSDVLESNGSTSMASTCGSSLSLMDAGAPLKSHISGIAMGLIKEGDKSVVLSDIQGIEDFLGDMDFKVTGNSEGITALQMDIKVKGISVEIMREALEQALKGRLHILEKMNAAISKPRAELSEYAPRIITIRIDKEDIGAVIGPGGKNIRGIIEETEASIDIEDDGLITITSLGSGGERAREIIERMTMKVEAGMVMVGKVVRIIPIGAFIELVPGKDGMVHISQIAHERVNNIEDYLQVEDEVLVKVKEIDDMGRVNLTIKGVDNETRAKHDFDPLPMPDPSERQQYNDRGDRGGDRDRRPSGGGDRDRGPRGGGGDRNRGPRGGGGGGRDRY